MRGKDSFEPNFSCPNKDCSDPFDPEYVYNARLVSGFKDEIAENGKCIHV
jgi:hypothetical protein